MNFQKRYYWLFPLSCLLTPATTWAEITFDGTLGAPATLTGPNYNLNTNLGTQVGNNLFHSFGKFNVGIGETAIFESSPNILNIIGRVTGGQTSFIDGTIKSPSNLYLLNPYGIAIGKQAKLDINGSLHLGSADYLRFRDGQQLQVNSARPLLTMANPEAFGFLSSSPGNITVSGKVETSKGQDLSLVGGNLRINGGYLYAPQGRVQLLSATSAGEVKLSNVMENTLTEFGEVTVEKRSMIDVNAKYAKDGKSGSVLIRSGQFFMSDSDIQTLGDAGTGNIEITASNRLQESGSSQIWMLTTDGEAGKIVLHGQAVELSNGGAVISKTQGQGQAGDIEITASNQLQVSEKDSQIRMLTTNGEAGKIVLHGQAVELSNGGAIISETQGQGQGGDITVETAKLTITQGAGIRTASSSRGKGGWLNVTAHELLMDAGLMQAVTFSTGNAGNIDVKTHQLRLTNGAQINASSTSNGKGGEINVEVSDIATIEGYIGKLEKSNINPSGIASSAFGSGQGGMIHLSARSLHLDRFGTIQTLTKSDGKAGNIMLNVNELHITGGSDIDASNEGTGKEKGGEIAITAKDSVFITATPVTKKMLGVAGGIVRENFLGGIYSIANKQGIGGNVSLSTKQLILQENGVISVGSTGAGNAGNLTLTVEEALTMDNAEIITQADQARGGNIDINMPLRIHLQESKITARAEGLEQGDQAGNVTVSSQQFFTLNRSLILASAIGGKGGNITFTSKNFIKSADSILNASSKKNIDGIISIHASAENLNGITTLPTTFFKAEELIEKSCAERFGAGISSLLVSYREILPETPQALGVHIPAKLLKTNETVPLTPTKIQNAVSEKNTGQTSFVCPSINR